MLTKKSLQDLSEEALRDEVLIPLLKIMGHQDVREYHGGVEEQGKDIVSWKHNDLGGRVNFALVVKAIPVTGQANTRKGSAGEVLMQIQQCFGEGFRDPVTLDQHQVHQCWVVTNKTISNEARRSLESALRAAGRERYVELIDGETLWKLVEQHMPAARAINTLGEVKQTLDELDPHYRPTVHMSGSDIVLGVEPKHPGAAEEVPFEMKASVVIPAIPENESLIQAMQWTIATGAPIDVPGEFVHMTLPEMFAKLMGPEVSTLRIGPTQYPEPILARLEFESDDGARHILEYVHFVATQVGTDEVTVTNEQQPIPIHMTLVLRPKAGEAQMSFGYAPLPMNVHQFLEIVQFQVVVSRPFTLRMIHLDTGLPMLQMQLSDAALQPPEVGILEEISDLDAVQAKVRRPIVLPSRDLTEGEIETIAKLRTILHHGEVGGKVTGRMHTTLLRDDVRECLELYEREGVKLLRLTGDGSEELFGTTLPLGSVVITVRDVQLVNLADVKAKLTEPATGDDAIELEFEASEDSTCVYQYPEWGATVVEWRPDDEPVSS